MQSRNTRTAYLKRMLKRLDGEEARLQELVGELTPEAVKLGTEQLNRVRTELLAELGMLDGESVAR